MRNLRRLIATLVLALSLSTVALAGIIQGPPAPDPPPPAPEEEVTIGEMLLLELLAAIL